MRCASADHSYYFGTNLGSRPFEYTAHRARAREVGGEGMRSRVETVVVLIVGLVAIALIVLLSWLFLETRI